MRMRAPARLVLFVTFLLLPSLVPGAGRAAARPIQASPPTALHVGEAVAQRTARSAASAPVYAVTMQGKAVYFNMSGLEPDFDPIYRLDVSATLHDTRTGTTALPDAMLVLAAYMEVFQPDTTPVLPDLLHPNQIASNLAGFLSGKAALVNAAGKVVYRGSLLAEIFQNNSEHLVIDLSPIGKATSVRLEGPISLVKGGAEHGTMRVLQPLSRALLAVAHRPAPPWQSVVAQMTVAKPVMMGTAAPPGARPAKPSTIAPLAMQQTTSAAGCSLLCRIDRPIILAPLSLGAVLVLAGLVLALRPQRGQGRETPRVEPSSVEAD
jgi:hypothetical protein